MPETAAGPGWGLGALTGLFESNVLSNVFASVVDGKGKDGEGEADAGAVTHVPPRSRQQRQSAGLEPTPPPAVGSADRMTRLASDTGSENDLPELGPLQRYKTPATSVPTSDDEPAGRRRVSGNVEVRV